jgi:hypothetical protein
VLGHTFEIQPALKTPDGTKKPDYVCYRDLAALNANKKRTLDEGLLVDLSPHPDHALPAAIDPVRSGV